jgi:hypothetical protein
VTLFGERGDDSNAAETMATVDGAVLQDALVEAVRVGWLVSVSSARDGYALRLTVIDGGAKSGIWLEDAAALEKALHGLTRSAKLAQAGDSQVGPGTGGGPV